MTSGNCIQIKCFFVLKSFFLKNISPINTAMQYSTVHTYIMPARSTAKPKTIAPTQIEIRSYYFSHLAYKTCCFVEREKLTMATSSGRLPSVAAPGSKTASTVYESVSTSEDEELLDEEQEIPSTETRRLPRRVQQPPGSGIGAAIQLAWGLCALFMGVTLVALIVFRKHKHSKSSSSPNESPHAVVHKQDPLNEKNQAGSSTDSSADPSSASFNPYDHVPSSFLLNDWPFQEGYYTQPSIYNDTLVFVTEGDVFMVSNAFGAYSDEKPAVAVKLTTSEGNVVSPHYRNGKLVYTATHSVTREIYVNHQRRTCSETPILKIVGFKDNHDTSSHDTLLYAALSDRVGLPNVRLYEYHIPTSVISPVPLSQAVEASYHDSCYYFTRFRQSSHTVRYVGGTAESLWRYCQGDTTATHLTPDYNGTSKAPTFFKDHLYFMSDRDLHNVPTSMNLFRAKVKGDSLSHIEQLTYVSCHFGGLSLQEYSLDTVTGNIILRIGADLYRLFDSATNDIQILPIRVMSDFTHRQERFVSWKPSQMSHFDIFKTATKNLRFLATVRGQAWVVPKQNPGVTFQGGAGQNFPERSYLLAPSRRTAGAIRVLKSVYVPKLDKALLLATDPLSDTAEHAFYLVDVQPSSVNVFPDLNHLPIPLLGGSINGGPTATGGLGSIYPASVQVSPCGRRLAWTDTDGRICAMDLSSHNYVVLPSENELGEAMFGTETDLVWSPGGRYLGINHAASNEFLIISIADLGDPVDGELKIDRVVQVTSSRFNSYSMFWGNSQYKIVRDAVLGGKSSGPTTLYFLSDRDIQTDVQSPFGTRAPMPHFQDSSRVFALPLTDDYKRAFMGGGSSEVNVDPLLELMDDGGATSKGASRFLPSERMDQESLAARDVSIRFGPRDLTFARRAYRLNIPKGNYQFLAQTTDSTTFVLLEKIPEQDSMFIKAFSTGAYPSDDEYEATTWPVEVDKIWLSTNRDHLVVKLADHQVKGVINTAGGVAAMLADSSTKEDMAQLASVSISVLPHLEFSQMYDDAWRMLRDYFYDPELHQVDWAGVHRRYRSLVQRCTRREDLDDILGQLSAELSALHVFVYGGDYQYPLEGLPSLRSQNIPGSFGVTLQRDPEWNGYRIVEMPEIDEDYDILHDIPVYSPLSNTALSRTNQLGLSVGDIIVGIQGESIMNFPDLNFLLRGQAGQAVRLEVLRLSKRSSNESKAFETDSLVAVPQDRSMSNRVRYLAWKWKTTKLAESLAEKHNFTVAYTHLTDMDDAGMDTFARDFFPNFKAEVCFRERTPLFYFHIRNLTLRNTLKGSYNRR